MQTAPELLAQSANRARTRANQRIVVPRGGIQNGIMEPQDRMPEPPVAPYFECPSEPQGSQGCGPSNMEMGDVYSTLLIGFSAETCERDCESFVDGVAEEVGLK